MSTHPKPELFPQPFDDRKTEALCRLLDEVDETTSRAHEVVQGGTTVGGREVVPRLLLLIGRITGLAGSFAEIVSGEAMHLYGGPEWLELMRAREREIAAGVSPARDGERTLGELTREAAALLILADDDGPEARRLAERLWPGDWRELPAPGGAGGRPMPGRRALILMVACRCLREIALLPAPGHSLADPGQEGGTNRGQ